MSQIALIFFYSKCKTSLKISSLFKNPMRYIYAFGFEEDCGFSYVEKLATSDIKNEGFSILARFMKENFPKRKVLVFGHGQKDEAISFEQINTILTNYGPVEVALAAHLKDKKPGNQF